MDTTAWVAWHLILAAIFCVIFRKAGYSPWLGLLMAIPVVNFFVLLWFANATWPLEMGYTGQTTNPKINADWELKMVLRKATTLENHGHHEEAIRQLEAAALRAGESHPSTAFVRERIRQLQGKVSGRTA